MAPPQRGEQAKRALESAGYRVSMVTVPDAEHMEVVQEHAGEFLKWIKSHRTLSAKPLRGWPYIDPSRLSLGHGEGLAGPVLYSVWISRFVSSSAPIPLRSLNAED